MSLLPAPCSLRPVACALQPAACWPNPAPLARPPAQVAFPVGPLKAMQGWFAKHRDIAYMEELLGEIEKAGIPAHSPIEQRWTSSSSSPMSPASSSRPDDVHSWVGVIYYLPSDDPQVGQLASLWHLVLCVGRPGAG